MGSKAEVKANAPMAGLYSDGNITVKCKKLWANADTKGCYAIWTARKLSIDLFNSSSVYEAQSNQINPIYAADGIYMDRAAYIYCIPFTGNGTGTKVDVSYDKTNHRLTTTGGSYSYLNFSAPSFLPVNPIVKDVFVGQTIEFDLKSLNGYVTDSNPTITFRLYKRLVPNGTSQLVATYNPSSLSWTLKRELKNEDEGYIYSAEINATPYKNWINTTYSYRVFKKHIKGDVNEDDEVNINDVVAIINQMAGTASWRYANVNGDSNGTVDINDVVAVINIMAGK